MTFARAIVKLPIHIYRYTLSAFMGRTCRFMPTCSEYALEAIDRHGVRRGGALAVRRVCKCHPWGGSGYDPVPDASGERAQPSRPANGIGAG